MNEIWKDIDGYEWAYQVSNFGRVRSKNRVDKIGHPWHGKILKPFSQSSGYLNVALCDGHGKKKNYRIHRLVAKAFVKNPNNLPEVNHIDEIKTNNKPINLEWCTNRYNLNYGSRSERQSKSESNSPTIVNHLRKLAVQQRKQVDQFTLDGKFIKRWESISATKLGGFSISGVSHCCRNDTDSHHGYVFRFSNSDDALAIVGGNQNEKSN